mgnify:CR=1 FL=1|jgi:hypothetical protein
MSSFATALPHGPITEVFPDVFVVQGDFRMGPLVSINRNMIVLRQGRNLTLLNAIRLSVAGEKELAALGEVRHLVKLGHFHNRDYAYTRDRFKPRFWSPSEADAPDERLVEGAAGPVDRAEVFVFAGTGSREAAFVLKQSQGGLLLTCDSIQHWPNTQGCSFVGGLICKQMGFLSARAKIGPIWAKELTGKRPETLRPDFDRLLTRDFVHLLSGHGALLRDDARMEITTSAATALR